MWVFMVGFVVVKNRWLFGVEMFGFYGGVLYLCVIMLNYNIYEGLQFKNGRVSLEGI